MNKHNITPANYQSDFVLVLAKSGAAILADWLGVPVNEIVGNPRYAVATQRIHLWHMSTGACGEALELFECATQDKASGTPKEELTDALFYAVGMAKYIGIDDWLFWADEDEEENFEEESDGHESYVLAAATLDDCMKKYNVYFDHSKLEDVKQAWVVFMRKLINRLRDEFPDSLQDAIDCNVEKLSKRYEGIQYSNKAAQERADKAFPVDGT